MKHSKFLVFGIFLYLGNISSARAEGMQLVRSLVSQNLQLQVRTANSFYNSLTALEKHGLRIGQFRSEVDWPDSVLEKLETVTEHFYEIRCEEGNGDNGEFCITRAGEFQSPELLRNIYIENERVLFCSTYSRNSDEILSYEISSCTALNLRTGLIAGTNWRDSVRGDGFAFINNEEIL